ncbi:ABC transporter substrate-binding protein [Paracandidimonas soli]|uniref:ABC transporter substrate-binding protein n=1 Tax=Paracandidimonas soli TaxID=1917182 RepID=UPI003341A0DA
MARRFIHFAFFLVLSLCAGIAGAARQPIVLTDVAGRTITLKAPATRVVLAQARHFPVLALLHPDPVSILAGWSDEFKTSFTNDYEQYRKVFPAIARIPVVGRHTPDTFSVESTLGLRPDLVLLTSAFAGIGPGMKPEDSPLIRAFESAGVPVAVIDFFMDPLKNTEISLELLGKALGREERAQSVLAIYRERMARIRSRLDASPKERPPVFVHAHAGSTDCCNSPGVGTFNDMITFAGGHNIGSDVIRNATGQIGFEYINSRNPVVYVATGTGGAKRTRSGLSIGAGVDEQTARDSLRKVVASQGLGALAAVRSGNAHGIWHGFNDSPLHVVFIEALAHWIDPELFHDVSAQQTLDELNAFLPIPMQGTFMVSLSESPGRGSQSDKAAEAAAQ